MAPAKTHNAADGRREVRRATRTNRGAGPSQPRGVHQWQHHSPLLAAAPPVAAATGARSSKTMWESPEMLSARSLPEAGSIRRSTLITFSSSSTIALRATMRSSGVSLSRASLDLESLTRRGGRRSRHGDDAATRSAAHEDLHRLQARATELDEMSPTRGSTEPQQQRLPPTCTCLHRLAHSAAGARRSRRVGRAETSCTLGGTEGGCPLEAGASTQTAARPRCVTHPPIGKPAGSDCGLQERPPTRSARQQPGASAELRRPRAFSG